MNALPEAPPARRTVLHGLLAGFAAALLVQIPLTLVLGLLVRAVLDAAGFDAAATFGMVVSLAAFALCGGLGVAVGGWVALRGAVETRGVLAQAALSGPALLVLLVLVLPGQGGYDLAASLREALAVVLGAAVTAALADRRVRAAQDWEASATW